MNPPATCPRCGSGRLATTPMGPGSPHHARTDCRGCGRFVRWEPAPMTFARAASFVMPLGKHAGRTLEAIAADPGGLRYLEWLAVQAWVKGSLLRAIECYLDRPATGDD